jgi:hypothetical protein
MNSLEKRWKTIASKTGGANFVRNIAVQKILSRTGKDIIQEFSDHWNKYTLLSYWMVKAFLVLVRIF